MNLGPAAFLDVRAGPVDPGKAGRESRFPMDWAGGKRGPGRGRGRALAQPNKGRTGLPVFGGNFTGRTHGPILPSPSPVGDLFMRFSPFAWEFGGPTVAGAASKIRCFPGPPPVPVEADSRGPADGPEVQKAPGRMPETRGQGAWKKIWVPRDDAFPGRARAQPSVEGPHDRGRAEVPLDELGTQGRARWWAGGKRKCGKTPGRAGITVPFPLRPGGPVAPRAEARGRVFRGPRGPAPPARRATGNRSEPRGPRFSAPGRAGWACSVKGPMGGEPAQPQGPVRAFKTPISGRGPVIDPRNNSLASSASGRWPLGNKPRRM